MFHMNPNDKKININLNKRIPIKNKCKNNLIFR